ncbi:TIGR03086 family metal-binding protein [Actinophytocola gossypii]|uniref:TIGR03086 family protein n=1 Tax=Actinophytocola gossypii TaxID=2812003 RepID=A0ABT2JD41_9PSEU|nr:TIGR03086 family metal-binding protein [Actinophytocola gossypii]MCT2585777.1 TIGR03086 family protein [Actinophytocola gossypii]
MSEKFIAPAAATLLGVVHEIKPDQLTAPTPCAEYDVRALVHHLLFWGPSLVGAGRKELVRPPAAAESDVDLAGDDWVTALERLVGELVAAWSEPTAWQGVTWMGSDHELPAGQVGGMVTGELVLHSWDLARATGQRPGWDESLAEFVRAEVARNADQGRAMGVYGPAVAVGSDASALDRALALSGRDPAWTG